MCWDSKTAAKKKANKGKAGAPMAGFTAEWEQEEGWQWIRRHSEGFRYRCAHIIIFSCFVTILEWMSIKKKLLMDFARVGVGWKGGACLGVWLLTLAELTIHRTEPFPLLCFLLLQFLQLLCGSCGFSLPRKKKKKDDWLQNPTKYRDRLQTPSAGLKARQDTENCWQLKRLD